MVGATVVGNCNHGIVHSTEYSAFASVLPFSLHKPSVHQLSHHTVELLTRHTNGGSHGRAVELPAIFHAQHVAVQQTRLACERVVADHRVRHLSVKIIHSLSCYLVDQFLKLKLYPRFSLIHKLARHYLVAVAVILDGLALL